MLPPKILALFRLSCWTRFKLFLVKIKRDKVVTFLEACHVTSALTNQRLVIPFTNSKQQFAEQLI